MYFWRNFDVIENDVFAERWHLLSLCNTKNKTGVEKIANNRFGRLEA